MYETLYDDKSSHLGLLMSYLNTTYWCEDASSLRASPQCWTPSTQGSAKGTVLASRTLLSYVVFVDNESESSSKR